MSATWQPLSGYLATWQLLDQDSKRLFWLGQWQFSHMESDDWTQGNRKFQPYRLCKSGIWLPIYIWYIYPCRIGEKETRIERERERERERCFFVVFVESEREIDWVRGREELESIACFVWVTISIPCLSFHNYYIFSLFISVVEFLFEVSLHKFFTWLNLM